MEQKKTPKIAFAVVAAVALVVGGIAVFRLNAAGSSKDTRVAAKVGEAEIFEGDITARVELLREGGGLQEDEAWKRWLEDERKTPADVRESYVDEAIEAEVVRQAANAEGISVDEDYLQQELDAIIANYDAAYGEGAWEAGIRANGQNKEVALQVMRTAYLRSRLKSDITGFRESLDIQKYPMPEDVPYA